MLPVACRTYEKQRTNGALCRKAPDFLQDYLTTLGWLRRAEREFQEVLARRTREASKELVQELKAKCEKARGLQNTAASIDLKRPQPGLKKEKGNTEGELRCLIIIGEKKFEAASRTN